MFIRSEALIDVWEFHVPRDQNKKFITFLWSKVKGDQDKTTSIEVMESKSWTTEEKTNPSFYLVS